MVPSKANIKWENIKWQSSPHCAKSRKVFKDKKTFVGYRDTFEQCFAKLGLLSGKVGVVEVRPIIAPKCSNQKLERSMGRNRFSEQRVKYGPELFAWFRKGGSFWVNVKRTAYWRSLATKGASQAAIRAKLTNCIAMYKRMSARGGFCPKGSRWSATDLPQVIDYLGYQKNMDGAHRRMVAYGLGLKEIPCLVLKFEDVRKEDLKNTVPFLYREWDWFKAEVERFANG